MGLAVYIHIPFCVQKCNYCDFPSYPLAGQNVSEYLRALLGEISLYSGHFTGAEVDSVYVGGGTPGLLSEAQLEYLFGHLHERFVFAREAEVSFETNPGVVDLPKLTLLKELGVNRLSLGVQSLNDTVLRYLGRIHSAGQALEAYELARKAGFANINLDLINGIPGQSLGEWLETLQVLTKLRPEHLSVYGLIIEEGTPFGESWERGELKLPSEELRAEMFVKTGEILTAHGYSHYEISNYALPGKECRHNKVYWRNSPYLGFGAGAASFWQGVRRTNFKTVQDYIGLVQGCKYPVEESEKPNLKEQMAEYMFLGLRLLEGIEKSDFFSRFGFTLDSVYEKQLIELRKKNLLIDDGSNLKLTQTGLLLANEVFCEFLP